MSEVFSFDDVEYLDQASDYVRARLRFKEDLPIGDINRARESLLQRLTRHPFLQQFLRRTGVRDPEQEGLSLYSNTEPWTAIGEKLWAAMACADADLPESPITLGRDMSGTDPHGLPWGFGQAMRMLMGVPYLWRKEIDDIASAAPLPPHVLSREILATPYMFWSYEAARKLQEASGRHNNWTFIEHHSEGFNIVGDSSTPHDIEIVGAGVKYGRKWPDDFDERERPALEPILQRCAFLQSPFVDDLPVPLDRPRRRELRRAKEREDELVSVVRLRKPQHKSGDDEGTLRDVDWKHRWWVGGHYRAQWYPSLNAHKVIWIRPHLKGPDDKPILERVYVVER